MQKLSKNFYLIIAAVFVVTLVAVFLIASTFRGSVTPDPGALAQISLERGPCFGACPAYAVTVNSNDEVVFIGKSFVDYVGTRTYSVPAGTFEELLKQLQDLDFFNLSESYVDESVADLPGFTISVANVGDMTERTVTFLGLPPVVPQELIDFADQIDTSLEVATYGNYSGLEL